MTTDAKIIVVTRHTRLQELIRRFNTREQARFYIEHLGASFNDYEKEDSTYRGVVSEVINGLQSYGRVQSLDRTFLPNFIFDPHALVVVVGQDGLVANTLKYLNEQPVVGINPDPARIDGVLLPFKHNDAIKIIKEVINGGRPRKSVTMAEAILNDGQVLLGVNDLFIGPKSHTSARYEIQLGNRTEIQSSSGIIISTGLGSTGWFQSILAGAAGVMGSNLAESPLRNLQKGLPWDQRKLYFSVREPFPSQTTQTKLVFGTIDYDSNLFIDSLMPENGVIFSDGIENDFLPFNSGARVKIGIASKKGQLIC